MFRCLIIDNNTRTTELIKSSIKAIQKTSTTVLQEEHNEAVNFILKKKPHLVFINIDSTTISVLKMLFDITKYSLEVVPYLVAISAFKEKAFEAYQLDFSDFLLKPLNELSVTKSILKFKKKGLVTATKTICLKSNKDYQYVNIDDILYLKADNNTTDFYMADGSTIGAYKTLKVFENKMPDDFFRIHKSFIVNRNCVSRIHFGKSICIINNEYRIPFTKTFIQNINLINSELYSEALCALN